MFTLDAYAARSCPSKVHNAFHPGFTPPPGVVEVRTSEPALAFKERIFEKVSYIRGAVDLRPLRGEPSDVQEAALLAAAADGAPVIIAPMLPRDWQGHRSARPDFLVRGADQADGSAGYHPAQVKFHKVLELRATAEAEVHGARLARPGLRRPLDGIRYRLGVRLANTLQLSHYWRHLESLGLSASDGPWAALIGTDEVPERGLIFAWVRLDDLTLAANPGEDNPLTPLDRYDAEHGLRVELAERAATLPPEAPPIFRPVINRECPRCEWQHTCRALLGDDDLSVRISKAPLDVHEVLTLRGLGIATVSELAQADLDEVLPAFLPQVTHRNGSEARLRLAQRRARMIVDGVDLERLTSGPIDSLPAFEVEVDLDIETSTDDRVYLWGFQVTDAHGSYYRSFGEFADLDDRSEGHLAEAAMAWLKELASEHDVRVYHYSDYETVRLRRLASNRDLPALTWAVEWAADHFVDLFGVMRQHFFGTQGLGLKVVATSATGFHWRDVDPGGLNSQAWFDDAVHAPTDHERELARQRVLEYNEDDCLATRELRTWLRSLS